MKTVWTIRAVAINASVKLMRRVRILIWYLVLKNVKVKSNGCGVHAPLARSICIFAESTSYVRGCMIRKTLSNPLVYGLGITRSEGEKAMQQGGMD